MKLKKIRNALLVVLTLALVSATAVAVTWAASDTFNSVTNTFNESSIDVDISEVHWNGTPSTWSTTSGTAETNPNIPVNDQGKTIAAKYTQTDNIPKDPVLENTSTDEDEYVAMTALFKVKLTVDGTKDTNWRYLTHAQFIESIATLYNTNTTTEGFNTNYWTKATVAAANATSGKNVDYFVYKGNDGVLLKKQKAAAPLFDYVKVNKPVQVTSANVTDDTSLDTEEKRNAKIGKYRISDYTTTATTDYIYIDDLPEFDIVLTGFAVQKDGMEGNDATTKLANATTELENMIKAADLNKIDK